MESAFDKNFDKFELYVLKNIFKIPAGTVLPAYQGLNLTYTFAAEQQIDKEIEELRQHVLSQKCLSAFLKREISEKTRVLSDYNTHKHEIDRLFAALKRNASIKETICFLDDQVRELHQLTRVVDELRNSILTTCETNVVGNSTSFLSILGSVPPLLCPPEKDSLMNQISLNQIKVRT